jgi:hypothetical protein
LTFLPTQHILRAYRTSKKAVIMSKSDLISVTKQIIRAAAKFGLEEAGTITMGPAWPPFKTILSPVIGELEKRYPKFFLLDVPPGEKPPAEAQLVAKSAVDTIDSDEQLQNLVLDGFNRLEEGQYEIKNQINKITLRLEAINVSIDQLSDTNDNNFDKIMNQLTTIQQQLDNMGTSVGFQNQSTIFPLAFELPSGSIEAYVSLHIAGKKIELSVDKSRPHTTVDVAVPKSGVYSYHLEHQEVTTLYKRVGEEFIPSLVPIHSTDSGQINIVPNAVYKLERLLKLGDGGQNTVTMHLTKVLTPEEQAREDEEMIEYLDEIERQLREEDSD